MENCKVWCRGLKKIYDECRFLEEKNYITTAGDHDIFRKVIDYIFYQTKNSEINDTTVGIYLNNGRVSFTCDFDFFKTGCEILLNSFKKNMCRKYVFFTLDYFLKIIHTLLRKDFTMEFTYSELMDYLFNGENSIDGYYLFVNYESKYITVSKYREVFDESKMEDGTSTINNDIKILID